MRAGPGLQVHLRSALTVAVKRELLDCVGPAAALDNFVPHRTYILLLDLASAERVRQTLGLTGAGEIVTVVGSP
eukprot:tig00020965_g16846.t1